MGGGGQEEGEDLANFESEYILYYVLNNRDTRFFIPGLVTKPLIVLVDASGASRWTGGLVLVVKNSALNMA
jgi:hypothetical protein